MQSGAHFSAPGRPGPLNFVWYRLMFVGPLVTFLTPKSLRWLIDFEKNCVPLDKLSCPRNVEGVSDISIAVGKVPVLWAGRSGVLVWVGVVVLSGLQIVQTDCDTRPASYLKDTRGEAAGTWNWPVPSIWGRGSELLELYLYSCMPSCCGEGQIYFFITAVGESVLPLTLKGTIVCPYAFGHTCSLPTVVRAPRCLKKKLRNTIEFSLVTSLSTTRPVTL